MFKKLSAAGIAIDRVYFCPHTIKDKCACRKPKAGMIRRAQKELPILMEKSLLVGDKALDILAGKRAGLNTCLIAPAPGNPRVSPKPDFVVPDLAALAKAVL